jgi:cell division cycle 20-like protein 1 (cofactor of APC complex)
MVNAPSSSSEHHSGLNRPTRTTSPCRVGRAEGRGGVASSRGLRSEYKARLIGSSSSPSARRGRLGATGGGVGSDRKMRLYSVGGVDASSISSWQWGNTDSLVANLPSPRHNKAGSSVDFFCQTPVTSSVGSSLSSSFSLASSAESLRGSGVGDVYSDRFIPSRCASRLDLGASLLEGANAGEGEEQLSPRSGQPAAADTHREHQTVLHGLLRQEMLGPGATHCAASELTRRAEDERTPTREPPREPFGVSTSSPPILKFRSSRQSYADDLSRSLKAEPLSQCGRDLSASRRFKRKVPKSPFKVLDAPQLQDDFYLNLVDWSSQNVLAVALSSSVYLWSACTSKVTKLCDLEDENSITSVSWSQRGSYLAVGTDQGQVQLWDVSHCRKVRTMPGHSSRVGTLSWNSSTLASGSRDRQIFLRDVRTPEPFVSMLAGHKQEVCGLKWSLDGTQLASGGNDNRLLIWNGHSTEPILRFEEHCAAVKAIAWSPHQHGLLASGGGTADRCIRFWNTIKSESLRCVDTGSQVCNLMWAKNINELVSTHGYSQHQIVVWRYPSMAKVATLTGHTFRVLYLAMSPDGQTIVTGAGDETLRFWNAFPGPKNKDGSRLSMSPLFPGGADIR